MADDLVFASLSGGLNDSDSPSALQPNQCVTAHNVEFFASQCGERRNGCTDVDLPAALTAKDLICFLGRHLPTSNETGAELFAIAATVADSFVIQRKDTVWNSVTLSDTMATDVASVFGINAQTLHQKFFLAYNSDQDRLHVWDGTSLRRAGLAEPAVPTVADTGAGTYTPTKRFYRVRMTFQVSGVTKVRSEPSDSVTFTPSGTGTAARVTKPTTIEYATHWEVEAAAESSSGSGLAGNFYRIATTVVGTTTYDDSAAPSTYSTTGTLSEDIGDYSLIPSIKYLKADEDRLIMAGSWEDEALASRVTWTPVFNDPGVGNDERIPTDTDNFLDLDGMEGGGITGISDSIAGAWYVFKWAHVYKLVRTGEREFRAYDAIPITKVRGAIEGSIVSAVDEFGRGAIYFLDPNVGVCRVGLGGLQEHHGTDKRGAWGRFNKDATDIKARGVYYPDKKQIHWAVSVDGANRPNFSFILQVDAVRSVQEGIVGGLSTGDGTRAEALTMCLFADNINDNVARSLNLQPLIGLASPHYALRCDVGDTDNEDTYVATIRSGPQLPSGLLNRMGVLAGSLLVEPSTDVDLAVSVVRDLGVEQRDFIINCTPTQEETDGAVEDVIRDLDDLSLSGCRWVQVEFGDTDNPDRSGHWAVNMIAFKPSQEETA